MPWCSVVLFCFLVLCLCVCFCVFCLVGGFCVFVVGVLGVLLVGCGSVLGVFWVFGGDFRLFLGLFFGIMVLGAFLGIWPCVESSLFPCQCVMHCGAFSSFWGSIINL